MATISSSTLRSRIGAATRLRWVPESSIKYLGLWDDLFQVPTRAELADYVRFASGLMTVAGSGDHGEGFDCEDFSFAFMALARLRAAQKGAAHSVAVGLAFGVFTWRPNEAHCCNWMLLDAGDGTSDLFWLEPQDLVAGEPAAVTPRPFKDHQFEMLKIMIA